MTTLFQGLKTRFKVTPEWRRTLRAAERHLRRADQVLDTLFRARKGSRVAQVLAAASVAGQFIDFIAPDVSPHEALVEMGYLPLESGVGLFLCSLIHDAPGVETYRVIHTESREGKTQLVFWSVEGAPQAIAAVYVQDQLMAGPYLLDGNVATLKKLVREVAWAKHTNLTLKAQKGRMPSIRRNHWGGVVQEARSTFSESSSTYVLAPLDPVGIYIGHPAAQWYSDRLKHYRGENRTIRLMGASGVGKSTLARILGRGMVGDSARTLKVTSSALRQMAMSDVIDLAEYLTPDVFLLDDLVTDGENEDHLAFFETLHDRVSLTVLTYMSEDQANTDRDRSSGYRPGRIDETFHLNEPPLGVRRALLCHFFGGEFVDGTWQASACVTGCGKCEVCQAALTKYRVTPKVLADLSQRTEYMTAAYIRELVGRLQRFGLKTYKSEVTKLRGENRFKRRRGRKAQGSIRRKKLTPEGYPNLERTGGMRVPAMREWLGDQGLDKTGPRTDLVPRIEARIVLLRVQKAAELAAVNETSGTTETAKETSQDG